MDKPVENLRLMNPQQLLNFAKTSEANSKHQQDRITVLETELEEYIMVAETLDRFLVTSSKRDREANAVIRYYFNKNIVHNEKYTLSLLDDNELKPVIERALKQN